MLARPIVRDAAWVVVGQALAALGGLVGLKILTSLLPPSDFGELVLALGAVALATGTFCAPLLQAGLRFYPEAAASGAVGPFRRLTADMLFRVTALAGTALAATGAVWAVASGQPSRGLLFLAAGCLIATDVTRTFESNLLNAARRQRDYGMWIASDAWAKPLVAGVLLAGVGRWPALAVLGQAVGSAMVWAAFRTRAVREVVPPQEPRDEVWVADTRKAMVRFAVPLAPMAALGWFTALGDRYVLAAFAGTAEVGAYAAAYALASQPLIAVNGLVHATLRPVLYDAVARGDRRKQRRTIAAFVAAAFAVGTVGTLGFVAFGPRIGSWLLGAEFLPSVRLMPWIAAAYGVQGLQQSLEIVLYARHSTRSLLVLQILGSAAALTAYLAWIPGRGAMGAALATLTALTVSCVGTLLLVLRRERATVERFTPES